MKVFVALVLVIASVSARGSGPYLPSGWKPDGPSFYLPSEVARATPAPVVQEAVLFETEASGSDSLREYGPPKVQEVPVVATEQTFAQVIEEATVEQAANVEENSAQIAAIVEEVSTATEVAQVVEQEQAAELTDVQPTAAEVLEQTSEDVAPTAAIVEDVAPTAAIVEDVAPTAEVVEAVVLPVAQEAVAEVVVGVNNIAEALVNLEQEVKAVEVQVVEKAAEITQEISGALAQAPEGFLEYGPPGFTEYGPPKQEDLARLAVEVAAASAVQNNEVRRRRFSPKFRSARKH